MEHPDKTVLLTFHMSIDLQRNGISDGILDLGSENATFPSKRYLIRYPAVVDISRNIRSYVFLLK